MLNPQNILGQLVTYTCPLPLDECLSRLQIKAGQELESTADGLFVAQSHIEIIYNNQNEYLYAFRTRKESKRQTLKGHLKRLDAQHTEVEIDDRVPETTEGCLVFIAMIAFIGTLEKSGLAAAFLVGCGVVLFLAFVWSQVRRIRQEIIEIIVSALPPEVIKSSEDWQQD